jgi:hypothetical protein
MLNNDNVIRTDDDTIVIDGNVLPCKTIISFQG